MHHALKQEQKMIIYFSDPKDSSTSTILEWLLNINKAEVIVINTSEESDDFIDINTLNSNSISFVINHKVIANKDIKAVYFRRNGVKLRKIDQNNLTIEPKMKDYVFSNLLTSKEIISQFFNKIRKFGNEDVGRINKIMVLIEAKKAGFCIPEYIVTTSKTDLMNFIKKHKEVVVKSLDIGFQNIDKKKGTWKVGYTTLLNKNHLDDLPDFFPPSFFQNKINKSFEIRCFYYNSSFFAVAVFSQSNKKTELDYRRYDHEIPNREIPVVLSDSLKNKIRTIFDSINLNTGSIDIIVQDDLFYFLEINPVGQFENVSLSGNWYIEKHIAEFLCKNN